MYFVDMYALQMNLSAKVLRNKSNHLYCYHISVYLYDIALVHIILLIVHYTEPFFSFRDV